MVRVYSLFELSGYIKRVIALNFDEMVWVRAEILDVKTSRGHTYLELVEKDTSTENLRAQSKAIIWARQYQIIKERYGRQFDEIITKGSEVSLLVSVEYHEIFGFSLHVYNIDPDYTLGKIALARQQVLTQLSDERLLDRNKGLVLPEVLQRIAIISSDQAAGLRDFLDQLHSNPFGYTFSTRVFSSSMQGMYTPQEFLACMKAINSGAAAFDCIVVVRGGGSRSDLKVFDDYEISRSVATAKLPVLTGIGHETDQSVVDVVAFRCLKTPTAVAAYIVNHNLGYEEKMSHTLQQIKDRAGQLVNVRRGQIQTKRERTRVLAKLNLKVQQAGLAQLHNNIQFLTDRKLTEAKNDLQSISRSLHLMDPGTIMKRGYSVTEVDGHRLQSIENIRRHQEIVTTLLNGKIWSQVQDIRES